MKSVQILGTGMYLPERVISNDDLAQVVDTSDEWIFTRTGISARHVSTGEMTWQMGLAAAKEAIQNAKITPKDIDMVIGVTISPDYFYPSMACLLANQLGTDHPAAFDISAACSGFVYGLDMARRYLLDEDYSHVLLVCAETLSKQTDYDDRASCILFGDGAGAVVLGKGEGMYASALHCDEQNMKALACPALERRNPWMTETLPADDVAGEFPNDLKNGYCYMKGSDVYKFGVRVAPEVLKEACDKRGISPKDLDWIIFHQANLRIIEAAARQMEVPMEKMYHNIQYYGNTSSATIPICIHEGLQSGKIKKGQLIGMVGFGGGLTYAAAVMEVC